MKKLFLIALFLTSFSALAASKGFFVGAAAGQVKYGHAQDLEDSITKEGSLKAYDSKADATDSSTGSKFFLGYGFSNYFGLEFGMASLGTQELTADLSLKLPPAKGEFEGSYAWKAQYLGAVLTLPLGVVAPFVKFGTSTVTYSAKSDSKVTMNGKTGKDSTSTDEKGSGSVMGAGVEVAVGKGVGLRLESETYTAKDANDLELVFQMVSAGITYTF